MSEVEIIRSLFKGREDVFAIRWEKDSKSGYIPAYNLNWDEFKLHKEKGGTLKNFANKSFASLTDIRLANHLAGKEVIGIYPLLLDNTSWFIAADFDETIAKNNGWIAECQRFMEECGKHHLPVYLERSRSGKGGHVWLFFESAYPAIKSRKIFKQLLAACGIVSDKNSSFDRLFPNQDYHSGKELGNLIALPMQKMALEKQNACFINPSNQEAFENQWEFLSDVQKVSVSQLDELYKKIDEKSPNTNSSNTTINHRIDKLHIVLANCITVSKSCLPNLMYRYLRDNLNFVNLEYLVKKNSGKNTFGTETHLKSLDETGEMLTIPRGFIGNIIRYCRKQKIDYFLEDKRVKLEKVDYSFTAALFSYQQAAVDAAEKKDFGVIVSAPGSGKTIMGLSIIANKQQPALIIVHRKQLFDQWIERIQSFLGIPSFHIGRIEGGNCDIGQEITVAMVQSLQSDKLPEKLYQSFGTIIVDECHHIPRQNIQ